MYPVKLGLMRDNEKQTTIHRNFNDMCDIANILTNIVHTD